MFCIKDMRLETTISEEVQRLPRSIIETSNSGVESTIDTITTLDRWALVHGDEMRMLSAIEAPRQSSADHAHGWQRGTAAGRAEDHRGSDGGSLNLDQNASLLRINSWSQPRVLLMCEPGPSQLHVESPAMGVHPNKRCMGNSIVSALCACSFLVIITNIDVRSRLIAN